MHNLDWSDLRFVLAVAKEGSAAAAARSLDVNHSTVVRRVRAFEDRLQIRIFDHLSTGYRLVALPGAEAVYLSSTISGTSGTDWIAYRDTGQEVDHPGYLVVFNGSFGPGRGYWMLSEQRWTPDGTAPAVALDQDGVYTITGLNAGWNIISNPFDKDVSWAAVQSANGITQPLWQWTGSFRETSTFTSAQSGGEAFYFLNEGGASQLTIPGSPLAFSCSQSARRRFIFTWVSSILESVWRTR